MSNCRCRENTSEQPKPGNCHRVGWTRWLVVLIACAILSPRPATCAPPADLKPIRGSKAVELDPSRAWTLPVGRQSAAPSSVDLRIEADGTMLLAVVWSQPAGPHTCKDTDADWVSAGEVFQWTATGFIKFSTIPKVCAMWAVPAWVEGGPDRVLWVGDEVFQVLPKKAVPLPLPADLGVWKLGFRQGVLHALASRTPQEPTSVAAKEGNDARAAVQPKARPTLVSLHREGSRWVQEAEMALPPVPGSTAEPSANVNRHDGKPHPIEWNHVLSAHLGEDASAFTWNAGHGSTVWHGDYGGGEAMFEMFGAVLLRDSTFQAPLVAVPFPTPRSVAGGGTPFDVAGIIWRRDEPWFLVSRRTGAHLTTLAMRNGDWVSPAVDLVLADEGALRQVTVLDAGTPTIAIQGRDELRLATFLDDRWLEAASALRSRELDCVGHWSASIVRAPDGALLVASAALFYEEGECARKHPDARVTIERFAADRWTTVAALALFR